MVTKNWRQPPLVVFELHSIYARFQIHDQINDHAQEFREIFVYIFYGNIEMAQIKYLSLMPVLLKTSNIPSDLNPSIWRCKFLFECLIKGK